MLTYSNPRHEFITDDWPIGGQDRGTAIFRIQTNPKRGQRATRTCELRKARGTFGKLKTRTYSERARIVDGSDGRTYIIEFSSWGNFSVIKSSLDREVESINSREQPERYAELCSLMGIEL